MTLNNINQYGTEFQIKVLSSLLTHKEFLTNIHDIVSEEYFENNAQKWTIKEILKYYDKYHTTPSLEVLKVELQKLDNDVLKVSIKCFCSRPLRVTWHNQNEISELYSCK